MSSCSKWPPLMLMTIWPPTLPCIIQVICLNVKILCCVVNSCEYVSIKWKAITSPDCSLPSTTNVCSLACFFLYSALKQDWMLPELEEACDWISFLSYLENPFERSLTSFSLYWNLTFVNSDEFQPIFPRTYLKICLYSWLLLRHFLFCDFNICSMTLGYAFISPYTRKHYSLESVPWFVSFPKCREDFLGPSVTERRKSQNLFSAYSPTKHATWSFSL